MPNLSQENTTNITLNKKTGTLLKLNTKKKYVEDDIQFNINVRPGEATLNVVPSSDVEKTEASAGGLNVGYLVGQKTTQEPSDGYFLKIYNEAIGVASVGVSGWIENGDIVQNTNNNISYFPVNEATFSQTCSVQVEPSITVAQKNIHFSETETDICFIATGHGSATATATHSSVDPGFIETKQIGTTSASHEDSTTMVQFITGVTIPTPEESLNTFCVTTPNGNSTIDFLFSVDVNGNVLVE